MRILVLGGTAWLGRTVAQTALARGHDVTCAARGSAAPPDGVSFVVADRDEDDGLAALAGTPWDAVVDVSRQPGQVRRAVRDLDTGHWVLVSTGNVYASFAALEQGEDAPRRAPLDGDVMVDMETYGEAKVACEDAVRAGATTSTVVRSGLIGGPGDTSGRTGYWPWRFAHPVGAEVVVPDDLDFPCAVVDVRDLAAWLVLVAEQRRDGAFNATGPTTPLREVLATAASVSASTARPRPVAAERLRELGVQGWMGPVSLPLWIDDHGWRGFATMDTARARAAGLVTRPLAETLRDALAWEERRDEPRRAGLTDDDERRVLAAVGGRGAP
ncbi:MAG TPA: NAD-dependent epimerase/dehydratase family protein [Ornithinibacter sp.]|nr:NAD-dependent epimerase/dehydratase family protein [Ornithinibacter sp.]